MKRHIFRLTPLIAGLLACAHIATAQVRLTQTTTGAAQSATANTINLSSSTGVARGVQLYVDGELETVLSQVGSSAVWNVRRGNGNFASFQPAIAHKNGAGVYVNAAPNASRGSSFYEDSKAGACTSTSENYLPHINTKTNRIFDCPAQGPFSGRWVEIIGDTVGTKTGSTVTVFETGVGPGVHQTVFQFTNTPITLVDATVGAGTKIYDFPEGVITILGAAGAVKETTTSTLASTLNTAITYNWGVGTVTQTNGTLATTEQDLVPTTNGTASATINVEAAESGGARTAAPVQFDGHTTKKSAFFNVGIATNTDIDGDATTTWNGWVIITWAFNGDF